MQLAVAQGGMRWGHSITRGVFVVSVHMFVSIYRATSSSLDADARASYASLISSSYTCGRRAWIFISSMSTFDHS